MNEEMTYFFVFIAAISAVFILWTSNILYAAFSLVITFLAVAVLYVIAGAEFLGVTQIMIYVGGIIVLIIFGVMLTHPHHSKSPAQTSHNKWLALIVSGGLFSILVYAILSMNLGVPGVNESSIQDLGKGLMTDYLLPFELAALLLLVALIGATVIAARKEDQSS